MSDIGDHLPPDSYPGKSPNLVQLTDDDASIQLSSYYARPQRPPPNIKCVLVQLTGCIDSRQMLVKWCFNESFYSEAPKLPRRPPPNIKGVDTFAPTAVMAADTLNPVAPILSRTGEAQIPAGASTLSSNKIYANLYDPDTQKVFMLLHAVMILSR